jgi:hypothetical protein
MVYNAAGKALSISDADDLASFMMKYMNSEQRVRLMAERPALYARLFPQVSEETIISCVRAQMTADKE